MSSKTLLYIGKRILLAILTVWVVITVTFFVMHAVPGDPFTSEKALPQAAKDRLEEKFGLDKPLPVQYFNYLKDVVTEFDFGPSLKKDGMMVQDIIADGLKTSATPDGRHAGKPISKNLCASDGMNRGGITAYMQSVLKINSDNFVDGVPFDFIMHPSAVEGEKGLEDFQALIKIFFAHGGFAAQGNIISGDALREAQIHPEKYATLQVRVCGWNEYFVKLNKTKQDMFIKQCEVL